jgi:NAD-dependent dihydropyrimidine dehydrogenase PreA subunit
MPYKVVIDWPKCDGNGSCTDVCPQACFLEPQAGKAALKDDYDCIGCEGCVAACPKNAITILGL